MTIKKKILKALAGEVLDTPPIWMMRQAGRYLPEYRETRAQAGDFLSLCYNSDLAAEVTLQPIRRYGFDAAILFADILLLPQALGADLWFVTGEGPRLSTINSTDELKLLKPVDEIHDTLRPVYETVRILSKELPEETTLIGFAGAPWTVATYMIAGRGTPDQKPAHDLKDNNILAFENLIEILTKATIKYLSAQIDAGAEVVKIFDSWAGSLKGDDFYKYALEPTKKIVMESTGADCLAIDDSISSAWAAKYLQKDGCIQGNLNSSHMVSGGQNMIDEIETIVSDLSQGPHIFNLGHGITPEANPDNVALMIETIRNFKRS